ncbi:Cloroperoxidase [Dothidotthia symphoricarpi CBS 119687]|uniref:Cloroperoxidase n=1 Tax=Dothidotthia symphoricarpi CBS 119687 TaxID=1392245 RepID=A0A6A6ASQ2_9PLEO|nr:Cloroperoxidase [Dothidotthia symphoricarpi CBS 119687]KAF2133984.1 Cloroperoxidase [Dothidotthia symphoricarpi CBS 119687]
MKFTSFQLLAATLAPLTNAFPAAMFEAAAADPAVQARAEEMAKLLAKRQAGAGAATAIFEPVPIFNASAQKINVGPGSGNEYMAPSSSDLRGPCPGLNAFANHGFLPRDGYATVQQFVDTTMKVVGMGPLLSLFLSTLGATIDGDLTSWSIAGTPTLAQGGVTGVLANGLVGSHNKYEGDASPTRPDLYQVGNNYKTVTQQFQELIDYSPGGVVTLESLTSFRSHRFDTQIANNPYFFNGPFSGVLVQPAAYTFIFRFMANHSAENPTGLLSHEVIQSWFGVQGQSGSYNAVQGTERIPLNWYKRAVEYPYDVGYFLADVINAAALHPKFLDIGGNTGTTNSFTGVDATNLTGGIFNGATLLQGNNLGCFLYQLSAQAKPDILLNVLDQLTSAIGNIIGSLGCPQLMAIDKSQLEQFPGYTKGRVYG